jgi:membrane protein
VNLNIKKIINFLNDDILYFAASLSFFTILAILPILALMIVLVSTLTIFTAYINQFILFALDFLNPTHSEKLLTTISGFLSMIAICSLLSHICCFSPCF